MKKRYYRNRGAHGDSSLILRPLGLLSEKPPLLSKCESGGSMSLGPSGVLHHSRAQPE